jgi:hypothetical protein
VTRQGSEKNGWGVPSVTFCGTVELHITWRLVILFMADKQTRVKVTAKSQYKRQVQASVTIH